MYKICYNLKVQVSWPFGKVLQLYAFGLHKGTLMSKTKVCCCCSQSTTRFDVLCVLY